ncbi:MAG: alpha/beta fold hydrolase [Candidatus Omnitrophica bacterium]|nr:alpha/beta fold hydrolase [Candidatus Omnitrophota bacterium]
MEKQVVFESKNGKLFGIVHIAEKKQSPGVILFHGLTGNKSESHFIFTKLARRLCENGISVLRFDFYGGGDSEGKFEEMSLETEMVDGESAIEYFKKQKFILNENIGVLGLSMGAIIGTYIASKYNTKSLCLWSPLAFPSIIKKKILTKKMLKKIKTTGKCYIPGWGHYIGKDFLKSIEKIKIDEYAEKYKGNVLIIYAKDDKSLDFKNPIFYFDKFHKNTLNLKMLILDKGGHTFTTEESENKVIEETLKFFKEVLNP